MRMHIISPAVALAALVLATTGCGFQHGQSVVNPVAPTTAGNGAPPTPVAGAPSLVGTWISNEVTLPGADTCGHFQYQIASQTATSISGSLYLRCANVTVTADASGQLNGSTVTLILTGSGTLPGISIPCAFSLSANATIEDNGTVLRIPYSGTTCLGPVHGTEVLHKPVASPPPPPDPTPAPTPSPEPAPPSLAPGGFDLNAVQFVGGSPDIRGFAVTSTVTSIAFSGGTFRIDHSKRGQWPGVDIGGALQEATIFIFEQVDGRWYGTGGERLRPFQTDKQLARPSDLTSEWFYSPYWSPLDGHRLQPGETVGFAVVAGSARADFNCPVRERSNIALIRFPDDGGGVPPFIWTERFGRPVGGY